MCGEAMLDAHDGGVSTPYPLIRMQATNAMTLLADLERQQEPIAYTTQLALRVSNKLAGTRHGVIDACAKNIWGDQGVALYAHPPATRLSEEEIEEHSHKWANAEPPWKGPVERTYARAVFMDGLRYYRDHFTAAKEVRGLSVVAEVRDEVLHNAEGYPNEQVNWCLGIIDDLTTRLESLNTDSHGK